MHSIAALAIQAPPSTPNTTAPDAQVAAPALALAHAPVTTDAVLHMTAAAMLRPALVISNVPGPSIAAPGRGCLCRTSR